jgi:hypothetical protein
MKRSALAYLLSYTKLWSVLIAAKEVTMCTLMAAPDWSSSEERVSTWKAHLMPFSARFVSLV